MEVTIYKTLLETKNGFYRDVNFIFDRIKNGKSRRQVEEIRLEPDPIKKEELKKKLPFIMFQGKFKERNDHGINQFSGLMILDFDKFDNHKTLHDFKNEIIKDSHVFAAFISPKGLGLKVIVKIPDSPKDYKLYFDAAAIYFDSEYFDSKNGNLSRGCFESYDPEIYVNHNSKLFEYKEEPSIEFIGTSEPSIPVTSDSKIIDNLLKWFDKKYSMVNGSRNHNVFILASAFNEFGIQYSEAERILTGYSAKDFPAREIIKTVKSAYNNTAAFHTKFFEDNTRKQEIEKQVKNGKTVKEITKTLPDIPKESVAKAVENFKNNQDYSVFWNYDKNGNIKLIPHKFKFYLENNSFSKFFPTESKTFTFIQIDNNRVEETNEKRIKDFVLNDLMNRSNVGFKPYDYMAMNGRFFTTDFLSMLDSADIEIKEDTKDECFLYYQNHTIKVTKDKVKEIDYIDVKGYVWKNRIIDRDFKRTDHHDSIFRKFIWLIAGQDKNKYNTFKSVIGYLLHSHKTSANNKAIIFNDSVISENPNGGSGKGLFWNALSHLKKVSSIDGKTFDFNKSFAYQTVSTDCQLLVFDDVKKNFDFERLFSLITEGITIEYKGQDAIKLPINKSPKLIITTNYTVGGVGGSFERRKFEVEMASHFNSNHTPLQEFGHLFFDEWNAEEWAKFDNYMINCIQYFLENGLVQNEFDNIETRKFIKNTSFEFYEWTKNHDVFGFNQRLSKKAMFDTMIDEYQDLKKWVTQKRFKGWLENYCKFYDYEYSEGIDNSIGRYFEIIKEDEENLKAPF